MCIGVRIRVIGSACPLPGVSKSDAVKGFAGGGVEAPMRRWRVAREGERATYMPASARRPDGTK